MYSLQVSNQTTRFDDERDSGKLCEKGSKMNIENKLVKGYHNESDMVIEKSSNRETIGSRPKE